MPLKAARQRALAALLRTRQVSSQALVLEHLRAQGFDATQATISRDLDDLGAVKVRGPDGRLVYALPEPDNGLGADHDEVRRMLGASLLAIVPSGNLVVLRTPPGHAGDRPGPAAMIWGPPSTTPPNLVRGKILAPPVPTALYCLTIREKGF